ncbi:unnamed protein product, partial [Mesorhabditis belari]|uniref:C-type lectin domain-containing protein n=1 Tax=Mesorhabditis belari TaxID=2138241 RepID=A0AAF3FAW6_9BILA
MSLSRSILTTFSLFLSVNALTCPSTTFQIPNEAVCLYPFPTLLNYLDAILACNSVGGTVAKVQNVFENNLLFTYSSQYFNVSQQFIGVQRTTLGTYIYEDNTPLTYQNWDQDEPKSSGNCVLLDSLTLKWKATDCAQPRPFFCTIGATKCDNGWSYFAKTDSCYYVQPYTGSIYSFQEAETACVNMGVGTHLVSIHSLEEDDFVYNLVPRAIIDSSSDCEKVYVWIGLNGGNGKIGSGAWTDHSPVDYGLWPTGSGYWGMPKASTGSQYCDGLQYDYYSTILGHQFGRFVCKRSAT